MDPSSSSGHQRDDPGPSSPWSVPNWSTASVSSNRHPALAPPLPTRIESIIEPGSSAYGLSPQESQSHNDRAPQAPYSNSEPPPALDRLRLDSPTATRSKGKERATFVDSKGDVLFWRTYLSEEDDMEDIMRLTEQELSEPYNIFTFRYFLQEWPHLTIMVYPSSDSVRAIATIVAKQEGHTGKIRSTSRGYIAMLSVDRAWRRRGIATRLVQLVIDEMIHCGVDEVVLETEYDNASSLALYESMGFIREKRLHRFYTNCKDAFRLILPINPIYSLEESPSEAEMARWMIGSGSDEYASPNYGVAEQRRSGTPLPESGQRYDDLYT